MQSFRKLLTGHRRFAALLLAMTLALKILVPGGYMLGMQDTGITMQICSGTTGGESWTASIPLRHGGEDSDHQKAAKECPFTALSMHALSGADPLVLALAIAFVLALGFAPVPLLRVARPAFLIPPLRGPPAIS
jgi:hypothetical protein